MFKFFFFIVVCLIISASAIPWKVNESHNRVRRAIKPIKGLIEKTKNTAGKIISALSSVKDAVEQGIRISELKAELKRQMKEDDVKPQCYCSDPLHCACCIQFEEIDKCCVHATLNPVQRIITNVVTYGDRKILSAEIKDKQRTDKCDYLPPPLDPVKICMSSVGLTKYGNGMQGCFKITTENIVFNHCINHDEGRTNII